MGEDLVYRVSNWGSPLSLGPLVESRCLHGRVSLGCMRRNVATIRPHFMIRPGSTSRRNGKTGCPDNSSRIPGKTICPDSCNMCCGHLFPHQTPRFHGGCRGTPPTGSLFCTSSSRGDRVVCRQYASHGLGRRCVGTSVYAVTHIFHCDCHCGCFFGTNHGL